MCAPLLASTAPASASSAPASKPSCKIEISCEVGDDPATVASEVDDSPAKDDPYLPPGANADAFSQYYDGVDTDSSSTWAWTISSDEDI